MSIRFDHHERGRSGSEQPIRGIARLVNPPEDDREGISGEEDQADCDYLGRILQVADRALHQAKEMLHRTRRGRVLH
jgi:hypothetical protein